MGEFTWSAEQLDIINSRQCNLLVSAAAGSGKTAVLVERIVSLIADPGLDIDVDRLLVVTFTKDAAAQMKTKLGNRIAAYLEDNPDDRRMQRQQMLLNNAQITTMHSFCNSVVKEFFHDIDIDPCYRIGKDAELKLMRNSVLEDVLEEYYSKRDADFLDMVESFSSSRNDGNVGKLILRLASAADAQAWPVKWLDELEAGFPGRHDDGELPREWKDFLAGYASDMCTDAYDRAVECLSLCMLPNGSGNYEAAVRSDIAVLDGLKSAHTFEDFARLLGGAEFVRASTRHEDCDADLKEKIKNLRAAYKDLIQKRLAEKLFSKSEEEIAGEIRSCARPLITLIGVTRDFVCRFSAIKKDRNVLDFGDLEHFALEILAGHDEDGNIFAKEAALELHRRYCEIFVDEYQDSNAVQEQLVEIIAGNFAERPYTFMVGDVKQSIYKFRMAKPELFMDRFENYRTNPGQGKVITLGRNFRSRPEVIDSTNDVFRLSMRREVGRIVYDTEAELVCGRRELAGGCMDKLAEYKTEVIPVGTEAAEEGEEGAAALRKLEADRAARRICDLIASGIKADPSDPESRPVGYGDIVILLRTMKNWAEDYKEALERYNIPAYTDSSAGFLNSFEISVMLNYLRILDNPRQDIPLAAVLHSAIGGFSDDELTSIRVFGGTDVIFWESVCRYAEEGPDADLRDRMTEFINVYRSVRAMNLNRDIDRVIAAIYEKTGFYLYCTALPGGDRRASNLDMLMTYAAEYEAGSYSGLFCFVRYIEQILESEEDLEEAVSSEAGNSVRIMSIHKSKGLEFPVVIVGGMAKEIRNTDGNQSVVISSDYGLAAKCVRLEERARTDTLMRRALQLRMKLDNLGEELRLLYVAMTRAKQKLIMIGALGKKSENEIKWTAVSERTAPVYSVSYVAEAKCYFDFVYPAALKFGEDFEIVPPLQAQPDGDVRAEENSKHGYLDLEPGEDASVLGELRFIYGYADDTALPVKLSVSDIKRASHEDEAPAEPAPWIASAPQNAGAARGTLYHKVMQFIPFNLRTAEEVTAFLESLVKRGIIDGDERKVLNADDFAAFLNTELALRMQKADEAGKLRREQPFLFGRRACDIDPVSYAGHEQIIPIQGIIDCMFEENGRYVILDYKTDHIGPGRMEVLKDRYHVQLESYADAVGRILNVNIAERIIYSFTLNEVINV